MENYIKKDIYYNEQYGKLYEKIENGKVNTFKIDCKHGKIEHLFIKRMIPETNGIYYDLITPYGYGGPLIIDYTNKSELVNEFKNRFLKFCIDNKIVSEFIRFHPIFENALDFKDIYDVLYLRHTIGTNLSMYDNPIQSEFSKSTRKDIRKAERQGVEIKTILSPVDLSDFERLYKTTMDRNDADSYYYFDESYFIGMIKSLREYILEIQLIYENNIIASELYFTEGDLLHAHLLGSSDTMLKLNAGALLEAAAAKWGKEHGYRFIHHGGGRTNSSDDSLFVYKKKFGKNTQFDFYIGQKIWNKEVYDFLVKKHTSDLGKIIDENYFPKYRALK